MKKLLDFLRLFWLPVQLGAAVQRAKILARTNKKVYFVHTLNGSPVVLSRGQIARMCKSGAFHKGVTPEYVERKAYYSTAKRKP